MVTIDGMLAYIPYMDPSWVLEEVGFPGTSVVVFQETI